MAAYPGFQAAFAAEWPERHAWKSELDRDHLLSLPINQNPHVRAHDVVSAYCDALSRAKQRDENFHAMVCVIPDEVYENCRPWSKVKAGRKGKVQKLPSPEAMEMSVDFRRQLKGRAMEFGIPIQIVHESTLRLGHLARGIRAA